MLDDLVGVCDEERVDDIVPSWDDVPVRLAVADELGVSVVLPDSVWLELCVCEDELLEVFVRDCDDVTVTDDERVTVNDGVPVRLAVADELGVCVMLPETDGGGAGYM